jgi:hypothetical protein
VSKIINPSINRSGQFERATRIQKRLFPFPVQHTATHQQIAFHSRGKQKKRILLQRTTALHPFFPTPQIHCVPTTLVVIPIPCCVNQLATKKNPHSFPPPGLFVFQFVLLQNHYPEGELIQKKRTGREGKEQMEYTRKTAEEKNNHIGI